MSGDARLKNLAISDTGFVFDPLSGATFTVNATGLCVLTTLREGFTPEETVARLKGRFDGVTRDVAEDVRDFLRELVAHGLVDTDVEAV
jgi:PqqD family protein of HPr-rel-A system